MLKTNIDLELLERSNSSSVKFSFKELTRALQPFESQKFDESVKIDKNLFFFRDSAIEIHPSDFIPFSIICLVKSFFFFFLLVRSNFSRVLFLESPSAISFVPSSSISLSGIF